MISNSGTTNATSLSIYELNYLLSKTTVSTVMVKKVISVDENELVEYTTQKMLKNNIGCLPVTNASGEVTGIVTQNDVFKCFLNVLGWDEVGSIGKLSEIIAENKVNINHIGVYSFEDGIANLVIRCDTIEPDDLQADLERKGYKVLECFVRDK